MLSPGFVQGVAAGDVVSHDPSRRSISVLSRAGNVCLQLFHDGLPEPALAEFTDSVTELGGTMDGELPNLLVATIPARAGFAAIERFADSFERRFGAEWMFGNVFSESGEPLQWWT